MNEIWISVVDAELKTVTGARLSAAQANQSAHELREPQEGRWRLPAKPGERWQLTVSAKGYDSEQHQVEAGRGITQVTIGLRRPGQLSYCYGTDKRAFSPLAEVALRHLQGPGALEQLAKLSKKLELKWQPANPRAASSSDDQLVLVHAQGERLQQLDGELAKARIQVTPARAISHGERGPLFGLTAELVVRFAAQVKRPEAERIAARFGLRLSREVRHAGNAFVLLAPEPSYELLKLAEALAQLEQVIYAEPNLLFAPELDAYIPNDFLWAQVPHLQLIDAHEAWDLLDNVDVNLRGGSPQITIAVIDPHGVTPNHPDLTATLTDATSKLVTSVNFGAAPIAAQTVAGLSGDHGTQCAASATAAFDDNRGIPGVAPNCHLIGARIATTDAVAMADIYLWAAGFDNGSTAAGFPALPARPADVISSSWGVTGLALSNVIRDCFDFITSYGRGGRGAVLCFSLGNTGYVDFTNPGGGAFRAWPTYEKVIGVGSSINTGPTNPIPVSFHPDPTGDTTNIAVAVDRRTLFSPFGATALRKPDLVAPSHTAYDGAGNPIDPVVSAMRIGTGAIDGCPGAAVCNDYSAAFGGTSHSTPTVAGAVALILSARPGLNWVQVRDILRASCVRIDAAQANAIGQWQDLDGDGAIDYSRWYGAGRLEVDAAVAIALDPDAPLADVYVRENLSDNGDLPSPGSWWASPDIWVRQDATTPIPALAWGDPAPHQNARRGQDNAVFCRVRNRGGAPASTLYVRALLTHWAGLEFLFPQDFSPSVNVGAPIPNPLLPGTYLIGEARIDNLAVGADQIVKFTWPQALVPPETVLVSGVNVHWHPCLLVDASPHDGPTPLGGLSVPVQGNNNIAQRNIQIEEGGDASADTFIGMIAGSRSKAGVATLLIDASQLRSNLPIRLHLADPALMRQLLAAAERLSGQWRPGGGKGDEPCCTVTLEQRTRLRIRCGGCEVVIEAAPGTRVGGGCGGDGERPKLVAGKHQGIDTLEIHGLRGSLEIPLRLEAGQYVPLLVAAAGEGDLRITQRRGDGEYSGGYGISYRS